MTKGKRFFASSPRLGLRSPRPAPTRFQLHSILSLVPALRTSPCDLSSASRNDPLDSSAPAQMRNHPHTRVDDTPYPLPNPSHSPAWCSIACSHLPISSSCILRRRKCAENKSSFMRCSWDQRESPHSALHDCSSVRPLIAMPPYRQAVRRGCAWSRMGAPRILVPAPAYQSATDQAPSHPGKPTTDSRSGWHFRSAI